MSVLPIVLYPDERLKRVCEPTNDPDIVQQVAQDLLDTMDACPPRTVGIAAPQVGALYRIAVVDTDRNPKHPPGHGLMILVNPVIRERSGDQSFREGCLSIPEYTANIHRAQRIVVDALDCSLQPFTVEAVDFEAVVLQHEIDHLDGILFLDRIIDIKNDLFRRKQT